MGEAKKMKKERDEMKKELDEAYKALAKVKSELNEINLLNSKLLYSNKVFKAKNLTESQKVKVLAAFDKATSKKEAQLVYETVMENLNTQTTTKRPMTESVRGMASRVIAGAQNTKKPIIEVNSAFERMQKLAGIKK
jgi:N-dimethylarginine dimethylaminohydrolase